MRAKIKRYLAGAMTGIMAMSSVLGMTGITAFAEEETCTVGDFTYQKSTVKFGGTQYDSWSVLSYEGSDESVVIPNTIATDSNASMSDEELWEALDNGTLITGIEGNAFENGDGIVELSLPEYLSNVNSNSFNGLTSLVEYSGSPQKFEIEDGVLYNKKTLISYPKSRTGDFVMKTGTSESLRKDELRNLKLDSITISEEFKINNQLEKDSHGKDVFNYTFLGSEIGEYKGANTRDGSLFSNDGRRIIAFGMNSTADVTDITDANPYAFTTEEQLNRSNLPDSVKTSIPFSFYSGEDKGETFNTRYFNINGKTAFCYDYGKLNPEYVGDMSDYDSTIEPNTEKYNQVRALLYGGAPNDGDGLFEEIFGTEYDELSYGMDGDAAKNVVGSLVWEIVSGHSVDAMDIYGVGNNGFDEDNVQEYIDALRDRYIDKAESIDLGEFELKFYENNKPSNAQRLVVINKTYKPDVPDVPVEKPSIEISKQDISTKQELPGALLKVEKDGVVIDEWTSTETPHIIKDLEDGIYVLTEITAPEGYKVAEKITFEIKDGKAPATKITMYDAPDDTYVYISKQDATTKKELPGAKLVLKKGDVVIEEWVSTNEVHKIANLEDGEYTLTEITAPDGYEIAESITFTVKDGKTENTVIMYDEKTPEKDKPSKPSKPGIDGGYSGDEPKTEKPSNPDNITIIETPTEPAPQPEQPERQMPQTGDVFGVIPIMLLLLLCGAPAAVVYNKRKK